MQASHSSPAVFLNTFVRRIFQAFLIIGGLFVLGLLAWQGITAGGNPNPLAENTNSMSAIFDISVLVFREGLECVLVLAAIMAGMVGDKQVYRRPIVAGVGIGMGATVVTWFIAVGILSNLGESVSALNLQAATGLLAIIVLLVIMNWFFHKIYWGGWIVMHTRKKRQLLQEASDNPHAAQGRLWRGLALLGFASLYREGFEIVLFLQGYNLKLGSVVTLTGAGIGLILVGCVAVITFVLEKKLPYRKMLEMTGLLLGVVLLVMVGEQMQEMQLARWIPTTTISWLEPYTPGWMGMWFAIFPTVETLLGQALAALLVIGSFFIARKQGHGKGLAPVDLPREQTNAPLSSADTSH
ncbi:MAG: FTR1 family protein [Chthoniobacterales bacterium]